MHALVTGANGFLGRHVVAALLRAGHRVRALLGPRADARAAVWDAPVECVRADLVGADVLEPLCAGVDVIVHLAARVLGDDRERIVVARDGTERLLRAMAQSGARRLVLASSFAVYDWERVGSVLSEDSPLRAPDAPDCDAYTRAKLLQEELVRRHADSDGFGAIVLRASSLWGAGRLDGGDVGRRAGPLHFVLGPRRRLRLCYVENAAEAFAKAAELAGPGVRAINVVDAEPVDAWRYAHACLVRGFADPLCIPLPYRPARAGLRLADAALRRLGHPNALPGILGAARFEAQFQPAACPIEAARRELGWEPRFGFDEAVARTRVLPW